MSNSVDQRRQALLAFVERYRVALARQGAVVSTQRFSKGRTNGPYFLLVCRDADGRQRTVYLGGRGLLVDEARQILAELQAGAKQQLLLAKVRRHLLRRTRAAKRALDRELERIGLHRKGVEIRGWSSPTACRASNRP